MTASHEVCTLAPQDEASIKLEDCGCTFINLNINNKGLNPLSDFQLRSRLIKIYKKTQPDVIIHYTIKPVIYGSMAATKQKIPFVNNITGLGTAFIKKNWVTWLVKQLYQSSQKKAGYVFFQNREDQKLFHKENLIPETVPQEIIPGTGIDIKHFALKPYSKSTPGLFLLIARLIWDKGVGEFVEAARQIKSEFSEAHFQLLGFLDVKNRTAISREQVQEWEAEGVIEYLGDTEDVRPYIEKASCVVLPSYREGLPRTLLEAAAMARPIIATDVTGCREIVQDGQNGFLCKPKDTESLAKKMSVFLNLPLKKRSEMGLQGRKIIEKRFDEKKVVGTIINRINSILPLEVRS
jgi:glycosyltransferase involved in cell wall biosynthesis